MESSLVRRGLRVLRAGPGSGALLPPLRTRRRFYELLHRYSFRLFLRDVIRSHGRFAAADVSRYAGPGLAASYAEALVSLGLADIEAPPSGGRRLYRLRGDPPESFGPTLEWYVAEVLKRVFQMPALFDVKLSGVGAGGDYDVLARLDDGLLYVETKSSPPKQVTEGEIAAFLDRARDLAPDAAVFLVDTYLRMQDKIVPMFARELARRVAEPPEVERLQREVFAIGRHIFVTNSQPAIARNLKTVLRTYYTRRVQLL